MRHLQKIEKVEFEDQVKVRLKPEVAHERKVAILDLLEENYFAPAGDVSGPYHLRLFMEENKRMVFDINRMEDKTPAGLVKMPLSPLRSIIKDYFMICDSYYKAIKTASPAQIEAIDMGRRGLHNDGSNILRERLENKIDLDHNTARRLFTLICVLHIRQ